MSSAPFSNSILFQQWLGLRKSVRLLLAKYLLAPILRVLPTSTIPNDGWSTCSRVLSMLQGCGDVAVSCWTSAGAWLKEPMVVPYCSDKLQR